MNRRRALLTVVLLAAHNFAGSAQEPCKAPPLTREQVLAVVQKDELSPGRGIDLQKWNLQIHEDKCQYRVFADCCHELRGMHWSMLISREGRVLDVFRGR
jgi:hypothetical protein